MSNLGSPNHKKAVKLVVELDGDDIEHIDDNYYDNEEDDYDDDDNYDYDGGEEEYEFFDDYDDYP